MLKANAEMAVAAPAFPMFRHRSLNFVMTLFSNCSFLKTTFYVRLQVQRNEYNEDVELSRPHVQFYMHKKARNGS